MTFSSVLAKCPDIFPLPVSQNAKDPVSEDFQPALEMHCQHIFNFMNIDTVSLYESA